MTPDQLAKSGSEHGEQRALFAFLLMAETYGFKAAWDDRFYGAEREAALADYIVRPVPELHWIHAIPNGGLRDKATAGKLKAEGVKRGVLDIFLPLTMREPNPHPERNYHIAPVRPIKFCGLYVEMKRNATYIAGTRKAKIIDRAAGATSAEQDAFSAWVRSQNYAVAVCWNWREAGLHIQNYVELAAKMRLDGIS